MALLSLRYASAALASQAEVEVILPERGEQLRGGPVAPYRVLYLLHGLGDDALGWLRHSEIDSLVRGTDVAVVMPGAGHSFYLNMARGQCFFDFIADELPAYLSSVLPLSRRREDTFVCGNSMGGYGAMRLALLRPDRYARAASLSGALDAQRFVETYRLAGFDPRCAFGDDLKVSGTDADLLHLLERDARDGTVLPELWCHCGSSDELLDESRAFVARARELGVDVSYSEGPGGHLWTTWARVLPDALAWLTRA